jgi:hypothetical protein
MRTTLLTICALTLLACCWLTVMEPILRHPGFFPRMILDAFLGIVSLSTGLAVLFSPAGTWRWLALAAAVAAGAVGVRAIVRDAHAVHFEGFVLVIGAALFAQAALALWVLGLGQSREHA